MLETQFANDEGMLAIASIDYSDVSTRVLHSLAEKVDEINDLTGKVTLRAFDEYTRIHTGDQPWLGDPYLWDAFSEDY
jgi:hypothetical protein